MSSSPKNIRFYRFRLKKIHDELTRHAAVRMNLSILIADDEITRLDIKLSKQIFLVMVFETGHSFWQTKTDRKATKIAWHFGCSYEI